MKPGDPIPALELPPITKEQLVRYAGASGDFNPIHWDADFARSSGYDGPIAHGMLTMAFLGRALTDWAGASSVVRLKARFKAITRPGDRLTVTGTVVGRNPAEGGAERVEVELQATNQDGVVTTAGEATVITIRG